MSEEIEDPPRRCLVWEEPEKEMMEETTTIIAELVQVE